MTDHPKQCPCRLCELRELSTAAKPHVVFESGAIRSSCAESTRYDLISPIGLRRVAVACRDGGRKYGDFNWEKGMPVADLINHAIRHIYEYLSGDREEDHLGHAAWNLMAACHAEELWPELNEHTLRGIGCLPPTGRGGGANGVFVPSRSGVVDEVEDGGKAIPRIDRSDRQD